MEEVFIVADNIISPLGVTSAENFQHLVDGLSGIKQHQNSSISDVPFYASLFDKKDDFMLEDKEKKHTKFEQLLIKSIQDALSQTDMDVTNQNTLLIISSTKGNISLLETAENTPALQKRMALHTSAKLVAAYFGFTQLPVIVANACISGLLAIITGMRMIQAGQYQHVVVAGADVISKFVLSGFQSFQAISPEPCKPFDKNRKGINLGEAAATVVLSSDKNNHKNIKVMAGAITNDANHISGPSRTGKELYDAINRTMKAVGLSITDIGFISAHGTATLYNDEMEAKAIALAEMQSVPVNSLKAYYGHTLGAAGLVESVIAVHALQQNIILPSAGFDESGVTQPIHICNTLQKTPLSHCLKTASGFGGCNAALLLSKQ